MKVFFFPKNIRPFFLIGALLILGFLTGINAQANTIISSPPDSPVNGWGPNQNQSWGQSFMVPNGDTILQSFTFEMLSSPFSTSFEYRAYLFEFDSNTGLASGTALWTSNNQTVPASGSVSPVFTPNLQLTGGSTYIFTISTVEFPVSPGVLAQATFADPGNYSGGAFYINFSGTYNGLTSSPWDALFGPNADMGFSATFVPVPEPTSMLLLAIGGLLFVSRSLALRKGMTHIIFFRHHSKKRA